ncbi:hypothetical protein C7K38_06140 [Tetragenococcus osmophilus]|uniref:DUF3784 domain-containing protein n=1 Tax=Tetragenococcus osmophilus TaxID=526944 RepID=A0AA38CZ79_9ENTE|nr:hypothetical protein [Tetragenococcus osmophilus]AYW47978.1 hypothetical protein C7K38_06140 [Tetragenococcus osmophilus]GMA53697.1 hypothetical protein GCM10025857_50540 [Alicyclobacillus contaminans]GMA72372.1 hypothetical protein GCM10025885_14210 [Tetragenococcus osmophilus]
MIITLLSIMAIILVIMGGMLCVKQTIFLSLITENAQNKAFLRSFGIVFIILGILCFFVGLLNQLEWAITFLCIMLIISGIFSFLLAKKMQ